MTYQNLPIEVWFIALIDGTLTHESKLEFFDKLMLGAAYRRDAAMSALAGFQVTDGLFIGYSYDRETTQLRNYNSGSHEVFLRFELFNKVSKLVSPRFF